MLGQNARIVMKNVKPEVFSLTSTHSSKSAQSGDSNLGRAWLVNSDIKYQPKKETYQGLRHNLEENKKASYIKSPLRSLIQLEKITTKTNEEEPSLRKSGFVRLIQSDSDDNLSALRAVNRNMPLRPPLMHRPSGSYISSTALASAAKHDNT